MVIKYVTAHAGCVMAVTSACHNRSVGTGPGNFRQGVHIFPPAYYLIFKSLPSMWMRLSKHSQWQVVPLSTMHSQPLKHCMRHGQRLQAKISMSPFMKHWRQQWRSLGSTTIKQWHLMHILFQWVSLLHFLQFH